MLTFRYRFPPGETLPPDPISGDTPLLVAVLHAALADVDSAKAEFKNGVWTVHVDTGNDLTIYATKTLGLSRFKV